MLFVTLIFIIFLCWRSVIRYRKLFNPFTLSIQYSLLFIVIPQIILILLDAGEDSILSDFVIAISVFFIYIGTFLKLPLLKVYPFKNNRLIITFTFILLLILSIPLIPHLLNFGLSFRGLREFYEYVVFSPYASFYEIVKTLLLFLIIILFVRKRKMLLTIIVLSLILVFSGSKMAILGIVITFSTMWEEYRKMNYKYLLFSFPIIFMLLVGYHFTQSLKTSNISVFENALSYFDVYKQQSIALEMFIKGKIEYFYGEISLSSWYKIIPRFLWESKPKDFGFALLNYRIYPDYSADGYMPSFGLAYTFADFGFISIIFSGLSSGFFKNYFYDIFKGSSKSVVAFLLYIVEINIILVVLFSAYYLLSSIHKK